MSANRLKIKFIKICDYIVETTQKLKDKSWTIYSNGICLKAVNCDKYLGVFIDCHLKWEEHILHIFCRVRSKLAILRRLPLNLTSPLYKIYIYIYYLYLIIVAQSGHLSLVNHQNH